MVTSTTKSHGKPTVTSVTVEVVGSPKYPFGENDYTKDVDFQTLAVNGCSWCRETIDFEQPGITLYTRSEEHTSELPSLMRISYAVFCLKQQTTYRITKNIIS